MPNETKNKINNKRTRIYQSRVSQSQSFIAFRLMCLHFTCKHQTIHDDIRRAKGPRCPFHLKLAYDLCQYCNSQ